jgi:hypothetical protein
MNTESNNGPLPPAFGSWFQLYNKWLEYGMPEKDIFHHEHLDENGYHKHTFTQDYVKARCFEEQVAEPFTFHEIIAMENSAKQYMPSMDAVASLGQKLSAHRSLAHKLNLY